MLVQRDGLTYIDIVMRHYSPGDAFFHAQKLRDKYGKNVQISYCIRNSVPEFKFRMTLKEKLSESVLCPVV